MLYFLVEFSDKFSVLNVFRYITFRTGGSMITALLFVFLFGPAIINRLRIKQGKGQPIRTDGPQSHLISKSGTPTMGGLMILSGLTVSTVLWANPSNPYVWIVLGVTLGFGLVGFYDDYLKVTKQSHSGVSGRTRLLLEAMIAAGACFAIASLGRAPFATSLAFPFFKELIVNLGLFFFILFGAFIVVGAGNAVNFTDGLDGLAIVPVMIAAIASRSNVGVIGASIRTLVRGSIATGGSVYSSPASALPKSLAENGARSSTPSPTPMKWIGRPNFRAMATRMPPRAVPSSLVITSPVTPAILPNTSTCDSAFWPTVASSTSSTACGAVASAFLITRTIFPVRPSVRRGSADGRRCR